MTSLDKMAKTEHMNTTLGVKFALTPYYDILLMDVESAIELRDRLNNYLAWRIREQERRAERK